MVLFRYSESHYRNEFGLFYSLKTPSIILFLSYLRRNSCSPFPKMQARSGVYSGPVFFFFAPGVKRPGHEVHLWPPCGAEVTNEWSYTSSPHTFMIWTGPTLLCLWVPRNHFTFALRPKFCIISRGFLSLIYVFPKLIFLMLFDNWFNFAVWVRTGRQRNRSSNPDRGNTLPYSFWHCILRCSVSYSKLSKGYQDSLPLDLAAGTWN